MEQFSQRKVFRVIFWRIVDNQVLPVHETEYLGFEKSEGLRIPDEYLDKQEQQNKLYEKILTNN